MQQLPHTYTVEASAHNGSVTLRSGGLEPWESAPPPQFGGPGDRWSPETMLAGAVASCFILTFSAAARASSFPWVSLVCTVQGRLERIDGVTRFTEFTVRPTLSVAEGTDREKAIRLLKNAERGCFIANSLQSMVRLAPTIVEAESHERRITQTRRCPDRYRTHFPRRLLASVDCLPERPPKTS